MSVMLMSSSNVYELYSVDWDSNDTNNYNTRILMLLLLLLLLLLHYDYDYYYCTTQRIM